MRYDPGSHGGYIETKDQTFFTGLTINSDMPLFANTGSAGTSQSPDFFDTATSNYVNVGKPKGEMGWIFLGWAWVDGDGLGWQDYSDAPITIDGLVYNRAEKPTKVTFRTTFVAQWTPTETIVRFQPNKGSIAPGHETEMANKTLYVGDTVVLPAANAVFRDGYVFEGWSMEENGDATLQPGDKVTVVGSPGGMNIWAIWSKLSYTLHYDSQGGSSVPDLTGVAGWQEPRECRRPDASRLHLCRLVLQPRHHHPGGPGQGR